MAGEWTGLERSTRQLPGLALRLFDIKQRGRLSEKELGLRTRSQAETERSNLIGEGFRGKEVGVSQRNAATNEAVQKLNRDKFNTEQSQINPALKPVPIGKIAFIKSILAKKGGKSGINLGKYALPFINDLEASWTTGERAVDVFTRIKPNWKEYSDPMVEGLQKDLNRAVVEGNKENIKTIQDLITAVSDPNILDGFFAASAKLVKDQEAAVEIERLKATPKTKIIPYSQTEKGVGKLIAGRQSVADTNKAGRIEAAKIRAGKPPKKKDMTTKQISTEYRSWLNLKKNLDRGSDLEAIRDIIALTTGGGKALDAIDKKDTGALSAEIDKQIKYWGDRLNKKQAKVVPKKKVKRTGTYNGRKVVEYEDGTTAYAD